MKIIYFGLRYKTTLSRFVLLQLLKGPDRDERN